MMRYLTESIKQSLRYFPVTMLIGARQVGKSTLAKKLVEEKIMHDYITLDSTTNLTAALDDPDSFIKQFSKSVVIDEVQRAPELLRVIKERVDHTKQAPGQFILTGSANILATPEVSESLAGRMDIFELEGLSYAEITAKGAPKKTLEYLFNAMDTHELFEYFSEHGVKTKAISTKDLGDLIFYGGFPKVVINKSEGYKERWCNGYQTAYIERDVRNINNKIDIIALSKTFQAAALQTGNLLVTNNLAGTVGIDNRTTAQYLKIFELTFQMNLLRPWFSNVRKRLIKTPKLFMNDSGYACYHFGIYDANALMLSPYRGSLAETWFWAQLRAMISLTSSIKAHFYRTQHNKEVDFILEKGLKLRAIEFKWKKSINAKDLSGLKDFIQANEGKDVLGLIVYIGTELITLHDKIVAVPLHYFL